MNLAPFYYRNLIENKQIISDVIFYNVTLLDGKKLIEASTTLNQKLRPSYISVSEIYSKSDGGGTSKNKNVAIYKSLSEALERWAFYDKVDSDESHKYAFDINPSTCGMAAFPSLTSARAKENAMMEAVERFAIHQFNFMKLPIVKHHCEVSKLSHYEIITPFDNLHVSLLMYDNAGQFLYSFACRKHLNESFEHALVELARNMRVTKKIFNKKIELTGISDKRLQFYSSDEGKDKFESLLGNAPRNISVKATLICNTEITGPWSKYTKVWRTLFADSYAQDHNDETYFMF